MRVFAGPNGSGKSTIIDAVRKYTENGIAVDFGTYINADDIARLLRENKFTFDQYDFKTTKEEITEIAATSGLIGTKFTIEEFSDSFGIQNNSVQLNNPDKVEQLAQIFADFLRKKLLKERRKFSFETVSSHESKLDIMRQAAEAGYKVYLYFISTESPEINKYRVEVRTQKGGHHVDPDKIESRYYRSLDLLFDASQLDYSAYFFDNSGQDFKLFAHFKVAGETKKWDEIAMEEVPTWFIKYYSEKV